MKLSVEKKDLLNVIARAQNIVEKRNTMPILVNVLLEAKGDGLRGFATDLEVSLTDDIPAQVKSTGRVAVNAKSLFEIIKELPDGRIDLERKENNWLKISQNRAVFNIVGISPEEYPVFPTFTTQEFVKIEPSTLLEMIEKTIYSVSTDETRYHLNGVYLEVRPDKESAIYRMVATDGHRLSLIDRKIPGASGKTAPQGVIVPRKGLHEIRKLLESMDRQNEEKIEVAIEGAQLVVRSKTTVLMVRLIEGKYPNYQQLIPQNLKEHFLVQRDALMSSLKRVSLLSNAKSRGVTLAVTGGRMEISSNNPELGDAKEEIEVDYKGKDLKVGFNARYMLDVLASMHDEIVRVEMNDHLSPSLVKPHDDTTYTCVVMPMRI
ncbi:MAG TPA: DNA polymerase III subunit beta [Bdellovibrionales bacterium]|nr:DNA polymerase III subunit beta [Bdellovibrionales bacterium]